MCGQGSQQKNMLNENLFVCLMKTKHYQFRVLRVKKLQILDANVSSLCIKICRIGSKLSVVKEDQYQFKVIVKLKQSSSGQKKIKISSEIFLQNWKQKPLCGKLHIGSKYCRKDISVRKSEEEDLQ